MGIFEWVYRLPARVNRWFETISGATGFEAGAGKLTTYLTGMKSMGQRMEGHTRPDDAPDRDDDLKPDL